MIFKPEPAHEFFLKEGAEHTFLNSLLRDVEKSRNVNAWLYKYKVPGQAAFYGAAVCATCVSVGLLPLQMQWVFILALLDLCRQLFKLNANAMVMCTSNVFGFWIPCLFMTLATAFMVASLSADGGGQLFVIIAYFFFMVTMLFGDANCSTKRISKGTSCVSLLVSTLFFAGLVAAHQLGMVPSARNHIVTYVFMRRRITFGTLSFAIRLYMTPICFCFNFTYKAWCHPDRCAIIKIGICRSRVKKGDLAECLATYNTERARSLSTMNVVISQLTRSNTNRKKIRPFYHSMSNESSSFSSGSYSRPNSGRLTFHSKVKAENDRRSDGGATTTETDVEIGESSLMAQSKAAWTKRDASEDELGVDKGAPDDAPDGSGIARQTRD